MAHSAIECTWLAMGLLTLVLGPPGSPDGPMDQIRREKATPEVEMRLPDRFERAQPTARSDCPRAVTIATWTSSESDLPGPFPTREGSGKEHPRQFGGGKATMLARLDGVAVWCRPPFPGAPPERFRRRSSSPRTLILHGPCQ